MRIPTFALGLAILLTGFLSATPAADSGPREQPTDLALDLVLKSPQSFMFAEHVMFNASDANKDLVVTSARGVQLKPEIVIVRPGTMRIFRADEGRDEFTRQGGWYWRCGDTQGKSQFKQPGALIMVVRQQDGTVHCYSLVPDFRC